MDKHNLTFTISSFLCSLLAYSQHVLIDIHNLFITHSNPDSQNSINTQLTTTGSTCFAELPESFRLLSTIRKATSPVPPATSFHMFSINKLKGQFLQVFSYLQLVPKTWQTSLSISDEDPETLQTLSSKTSFTICLTPIVHKVVFRRNVTKHRSYQGSLFLLSNAVVVSKADLPWLLWEPNDSQSVYSHWKIARDKIKKIFFYIVSTFVCLDERHNWNDLTTLCRGNEQLEKDGNRYWVVCSK